MLQVFVKLVIIAVFLLVAVVASLRVWRADLDLRKLLSPRRAIESSVDERTSWLPTRDKDALYQGGNLVARVTNPTVDEARSQIRFDEIYQSKALDTGQEFEFRSWRAKIQSVDSLIGLSSAAPEKGQILTKVVCEITGSR